VLLVMLAALLAPASFAQSSAPRGGGQTQPFARIRPTGSHAAVTLQRGLRCCPTVRALVEQLERSDLIVYVTCARRPAGRSAASLQFMHATTEFRFVQIVIDIELALPQRLTLLGHELQHALEVAANPGIHDRKSFLQYYAQIDVRHQDPRALDTEAARQTGERVRQELATAGIVR
jgi:hypothetical protein